MNFFNKPASAFGAPSASAAPQNPTTTNGAFF
jgi:hypothetical protein